MSSPCLGLLHVTGDLECLGPKPRETPVHVSVVDQSTDWDPEKLRFLEEQPEATSPGYDTRDSGSPHPITLGLQEREGLQAHDGAFPISPMWKREAGTCTYSRSGSC